MKKILNYLKHLLSDSKEVSVRRFVGFTSFMFILITVISDLIFKATITEFIFDGLMIITLGCFSLTTITSFKKKEKNDNL